jgi:hypothetical protein
MAHRLSKFYAYCIVHNYKYSQRKQMFDYRKNNPLYGILSIDLFKAMSFDIKYLVYYYSDTSTLLTNIHLTEL